MHFKNNPYCGLSSLVVGIPVLDRVGGIILDTKNLKKVTHVIKCKGNVTYIYTT
jgi:hypothetical protein